MTDPTATTTAQQHTAIDRMWNMSDPVFDADEVKPEHKIWPWSGHRNFAYDLVRWLKPERIAELGVHWGTSFFAWSQAIKDEDLPCQLIGIDTFEGDEHAGEYDDEIYTTVTQLVSDRFASIDITLHKMFFDDALALVDDESCDIIHIDGLHTYEAVKHDYETWLCKLRPHGVMLFHDTADSSGYGSATFWNELAAEHPSFAFAHSWGLGVLFPKGDRVLGSLIKNNIEDKVKVYTYKAEYELQCIANNDKASLLSQRMRAIEAQAELINHRNTWIENLRGDLASAQLLAQERYDGLLSQTELIKHRDAWIENLKAELKAASQLAAERYDGLQSQSKLIQERNTRIQALEKKLTQAQEQDRAHGAEIQKLQSTLKMERDETTSLRKDIAARTSEITDLNTTLEATKRELTQRDTHLTQLDTLIDQLSLDLEALRVRAAHVEATNIAQQQHIDALDASLSRGWFRKMITREQRNPPS